MGPSKKQKKNAERLKKALKEYDDKGGETGEILRTAAQLGAAARAGDEEALDRLSAKVRRRGWLK